MRKLQTLNMPVAKRQLAHVCKPTQAEFALICIFAGKFSDYLKHIIMIRQALALINEFCKRGIGVNAAAAYAKIERSKRRLHLAATLVGGHKLLHKVVSWIFRKTSTIRPVGKRNLQSRRAAPISFGFLLLQTNPKILLLLLIDYFCRSNT